MRSPAAGDEGMTEDFPLDVDELLAVLNYLNIGVYVTDRDRRMEESKAARSSCREERLTAPCEGAILGERKFRRRSTLRKTAGRRRAA